MPVKGVRKVANVTGSGIEYVTRPVRKSKAFQAVKETVDDGSSSRYGGWVEKEERKRRRELRELNEFQRTGGRPQGPMEEDITYVHLRYTSKYRIDISLGLEPTSRFTRTPSTRRSGGTSATPAS